MSESADTGFFARMGERAAGRPAPLRVRAPQRFEPVPRGGPPRQSGVEAALPPADPSTALGLDIETVVDAARPLLPAKTAAAARPGPHRRVPQPVDAAVADASPPGDVLVPARPSPASRPSPLAETLQDRPPTAPLRPPPPVSVTSGASARAEHPLDGPSPAAAPLRPATEEPRTVEPAGLPALVELPNSVGPLSVAPPAVNVPDVDDLVRRHVLPALVARGLAGPHETVEVVSDAGAAGPDGVPAQRRSRRGPQAPTTLTVTPARYTTARGPDEPAVRRYRPVPASPTTPAMTASTRPGPPDFPQVHVHIDRVVVARPAPPPRPAPASPAPRSRPQPDHEAYLARRREVG